MSLAGWRDIALVVIAIVYIVFSVILLAVSFALWYFSRKGFGALERLIEKRVRPALDRTETQLLDLRDRTTRLPGNTSPTAEGMPVRAKRGGGGFPLPFRRKRRRIPLLPS